MSPGLIAAIAAVLADSIITIAVGWKLTHTARTEIAKGVEDVIEHAPELIARAMTTRGESDAGSNES